jgi:Fusaric acid resistance protein-like
MEYSFLATARGILDLVQYADSKVDDGTMKRKRLLLPSWKRMQQWFWAALSREDSNLDYEAYSTRSGTVTVYLGDALQTEKDAEHLPPVSMWEKVTDNFRIIPHFFGSSESAFGFRVATGTIVIAVVCYLRNSQLFFIEQRIIWGSIMVAISMTQTAGSGMFGQFSRFAGTALAMVASYIDWYIVDQHTAGVIVFVGVTMFLYHYLLIKSPDNPVVPMIGMVTVVLIVGYSLQIKKVGIPISESNGQQFHPLYELAPYRLAAVGGGVGVAALFTYFPYVVTARSQLRKDLGSSLYLLAHYYSSVHTTVSLRIRGTQGDLRDKKSPGRVLEKARSRVLAKELVLLQGMKRHCEFTAWEPTFGGKFPRDTYDRLIKHTQKLVLLPFQFQSQWLVVLTLDSILHFTTMIAYVTESFRNLPANAQTQTSSDWWLKDFKQLIISLELTSQEVTSLLSVVSSAIATGRPLPPYLKAPEPYHLGQLLDDLDTDILSTRHVCEPGYAAFAVMQVATTMLGDDLDGLLRETKNLVGEVDFGINVVRMEDLEGDMNPITAAKKRE